MALTRLEPFKFDDSAAEIETKMKALGTTLDDLFNTSLLTDDNFAPFANINGAKILNSSLTTAKFKNYKIDSAHLVPTVGITQSTAKYTPTKDEATDPGNAWEDINMSFSTNESFNYTVHIVAAFAVAGLLQATGQMEIRLEVDASGSAQGQTVFFRNPASDTKIRNHIMGVWAVDVASGAHTFNFQARITGTSPDYTQGSPKIRRQTWAKYLVVAQ